MGSAHADRWTRVAHAVVLVVLILGPLWIAWRLIPLMPASDPAAEARCAQLGCDGPPVLIELFLPFVPMVLIIGAMVWLGALGWQVFLALGKQTRPRLAGLALTDACWIAAALWGLREVADEGAGADAARLFAWAVIAVARADIGVCVVRAVASNRIAGGRLAS
jgi:hypothetical protein